MCARHARRVLLDREYAMHVNLTATPYVKIVLQVPLTAASQITQSVWFVPIALQGKVRRRLVQFIVIQCAYPVRQVSHSVLLMIRAAAKHVPRARPARVQLPLVHKILIQYVKIVPEVKMEHIVIRMIKVPASSARTARKVLGSC